MFVVSVAGPGAQGEHCEDGGDPDTGPGGGSCPTDPECDPGEGRDQPTRYKSLHYVH